MIRSPQNSKVKQIRRLLAHRRDRTKERLFVIEGTRWLDEYITANRSPHYIMATTSWLAEPAHATRLSRLQSPVFEIDEQLLNEVADTDSPPGILAVVPIEPVPVPSNLTFVLILDAIRTPGNLGTILRTAGAAGVDALLMAPGCVDPYNPKVVRSSMGAHLRVPLRQAGWADISRLCQGLTVWLAEGIGQQFYNNISWRQPSALIVGNEAHGPSADARRLATGSLAIPMHSGTESLNVAMAAGIIMFEVVRQRSAA